MSNAQITIPLNIPDVRVLQAQLTAQGEFIITVESLLRWSRYTELSVLGLDEIALKKIWTFKVLKPLGKESPYCKGLA